MRVVFRTDSSATIGSGHVMRCLTLADYLATRGYECLFTCRDLEGNCGHKIREHGHKLAVLPPPDNGSKQSKPFLIVDNATDAAQTAEHLRQMKGVEWLIVDHYGIDEGWKATLTKELGDDGPAHTLVIDDLADRAHRCDILLDQNLNSNSHRYDDLVPAACHRLLGPQFALLRPEFTEVAKRIEPKSGPIRRIFVFLGGVDNDNVTLKVVRALASMKLRDIAVDVVLGMANPHGNAVRDICRTIPNCAVHTDVANMAELMIKADLAIGGGGTTSMERAILGLPTLIIILADNQRPGTEALANTGAAVNLGFHTEVTEQDIVKAVEALLRNPGTLSAMSQRAPAIFGSGHITGAERVYNEMRNMESPWRAGFRLRPMTADDLEIVWNWRNSYRIRSQMYTDHIIEWSDHVAWFENVSRTGQSLHYVFEQNNRPLGVVNVTDIDRRHNRCHWGFYIGAEDAPKGSGTIMGFFALEHLFETLGFHRVIGEAIASNTASLAYHKRLGFVEEGRLSGHARKNGYYEDVITLAILRESWDVIKPQLIQTYLKNGGKS